MQEALGFRQRSYTALMALCLALGQWFWIFYASGERSIKGFLRALVQWDSYHYGTIATVGFFAPFPVMDNSGSPHAAWFPGYPLSVRKLMQLFDLEIFVALPLAAQIAALVFWLYFVAALRASRVHWGVIAAVGFCIMSYPSAFFMLTGYSESLFLCSVLGCCYWFSKKPTAYSYLFLIFHGFSASLTRLTGFAIAAVPVLWARDRKTRWGALAASAALLSGGLSYFAYSFVRFGAWGHYFKTQQQVWSLRPNPLAVFKRGSYRICTLDFFEIECLNRNTTTLTFFSLLLSGILIFYYFRNGKNSDFDFHSRRFCFSIYACAWIHFVISIGGVASRSMISMNRYTFPSFVFILISSVVALRGLNVRQYTFWVFFLILVSTGFLFYPFHNSSLIKFISRHWVA